MLQRKEYFVDLTDPKRDLINEERLQVEDGKGNLYSSEVAGVPGMHAPTLDIDGINVDLVDSTTPGNVHLYIDKPMTWDMYRRLLLVLQDCGILAEPYVRLSLARGATFLRKPGVLKTPDDTHAS